MQQLQTKLDGPVLVEPKVHGDERGFFVETYRKNAYAELGIGDDFVQDNHSRSRRVGVRGMHVPPGQAKLVRCASGAIADVICDIRPGSNALGEWEAVELTAENVVQPYVPDGF